MARSKLPATPVEPREIKTAVDAIQALRSYKSSPEPMLQLLGDALDHNQAVQLDAVSWSTEVTLDDEADDSGAGIGLDGLPIASNYAYFQIAELNGHLARFSGDYRGAIDIIDRLAGELEKRPNVESVEVLQYPLDVRSDASVSGSTTINEDRAVAAFRLKLVLGVSDGSQES